MVVSRRSIISVVWHALLRFIEKGNWETLKAAAELTDPGNGSQRPNGHCLDGCLIHRISNHQTIKAMTGWTLDSEKISGFLTSKQFALQIAAWDLVDVEHLTATKYPQQTPNGNEKSQTSGRPKEGLALVRWFQKVHCAVSTASSPNSVQSHEILWVEILHYCGSQNGSLLVTTPLVFWVQSIIPSNKSAQNTSKQCKNRWRSPLDFPVAGSTATCWASNFTFALTAVCLGIRLKGSTPKPV